MKLLTTLTFCLGGLLLAPGGAFACSCEWLPLARSKDAAYAVFAGRVVEHKAKTINGKYLHRYKIAVERSWKNAEARKIVVYSGGGCGSRLETGQKYLVFAYRSDDGRRLETNVCAGNRKFDPADEDLKELGEGNPVRRE